MDRQAEESTALAPTTIQLCPGLKKVCTDKNFSKRKIIAFKYSIRGSFALAGNFDILHICTLSPINSQSKSGTLQINLQKMRKLWPSENTSRPVVYRRSVTFQRHQHGGNLKVVATNWQRWRGRDDYACKSPFGTKSKKNISSSSSSHHHDHE